MTGSRVTPRHQGSPANARPCGFRGLMGASQSRSRRTISASDRGPMIDPENARRRRFVGQRSRGVRDRPRGADPTAPEQLLPPSISRGRNPDPRDRARGGVRTGSDVRGLSNPKPTRCGDNGTNTDWRSRLVPRHRPASAGRTAAARRHGVDHTWAPRFGRFRSRRRIRTEPAPWPAERPACD